MPIVVAAEIVGDPHGGDVHLALAENLLVGQVVLLVRAGDELHAALFHPAADRPGLVVADLRGFVIQGRLAQPLLVHAGGLSSSSGMMALYMPMQPSSKMPMMAFSRGELLGQGLAELAPRPRDFDLLERRDVLGRDA